MKKVASLTPKDFRSAYGKISSIRQTGGLLPILGSLHAASLNDNIVLTSTNLATYGITAMAAKIHDHIEPFLIPPAAIEVLDELPEAMEVELWLDGKNQLQLCSGDKLKVNFTYDSVADFPALPVLEPKVKLMVSKMEDLKTYLTEAKSFASKDDLKPFMTGVFFSSEVIVATDAHRLIVINHNPKPTKWPEFAGVIIPKQCILSLVGIDGKAETQITISDTHITFNDRKTKIISTVSPGASFPDYKSVLPKDNATSYILNRKELISSIKLALSVVNKQTNMVTLYFTPEEKTYNLTGGDTDYGNSINTHGIAQPSQGNLVTEVSFNGILLNHTLGILRNDEVQLQLVPQRAGIFREKQYTVMIMALADINKS